ncbi:hypothetical protein MVEN_00677100 [Mycena venus]|uniref:Uncharacterized protein n=1 Tax=Mycena venus TaxID=2733690 RepID=A0A8H6YR21_9AGAR|nr:hypothetical protein MVEN_00677100 [Mycena venus]
MIHCARIDGHKSDMTVTIYQGDRAERDWLKDISPYSRLRHPNLLQLYGVAISSGLHAAVFRDELIPYGLFVERFRDITHVQRMYLWAYCASDFCLAREYMQMMFHQNIYPRVSKTWIRSSTGRLCMEPMERFYPCYVFPDIPAESSWTPSESDSFTVLHEAQPESYMEIVSSMPLELYHSLCWNLFHDIPHIKIPQSEMMRVGTIIFCPSSTESLDSHGQIVAFLEPVSLHFNGWNCSCSGPNGSYTSLASNLLDNGWTRIHDEGGLLMFMRISYEGRDWLSQANYIFGQLHVNSNHHNYGYIHRCDFQLWISPTGPGVPSGYLFVCPPEDLQVGPSLFRWPDCPAYWSRDPNGLDPLDAEEAARLGYPTIKLHRYVRLQSCYSEVYTGLRQFHKAKGFDPDSQEVARHLGHSLFKLVDPPIPFGAVPFTYSQLL